jgi:hypothetical protein
MRWARVLWVRVHPHRANFRLFRHFEEIIILELLVGTWERAAVLLLPERLQIRPIDHAGVIREERGKLRANVNRHACSNVKGAAMRLLSGLCRRRV